MNQTTGVEWTPDFKVAKVTEPTTRATSYTYNTNGYLTSHTNQLNERTEVSYLDQPVDANDTGRHLSLLSTVTKPKGVATTTVGDFQWRYSYDPVGNVDRMTDPTGAVNDYDFNGPGTANPGTVAAITDPNQNRTTFPSYDPSGQPAEQVDPLGNRTRFAYDVDGQLIWIQDPRHAGDSGDDVRAYRSFFDYDPFHRLTRQSAPKSTGTARGRLIWSSVSFDANDNLLRKVDPHYGGQDSTGTTGPTATASYDNMDQILEASNPDKTVDPAGERQAYAYDAAGRMVKRTMPLGVLSATIPDDHATVISYDGLDRPVRETTFGANTTQSRGTHLCYDLAGDLVSVTSPRAGANAPACPGTAGRFTATYTYDSAHRRLTERDPAGNTERTTYDANGNVASLEQDIDTNRASRQEIEYDQRDRPVLNRQRFDGATNRNITSRIEYDAAGNRKREISPRGSDAGGAGPFTHYVTVYDYDKLNRPVRITLPFDAADGAERQYVHRAYDPNGNLDWISPPVTSANAADVRDTAKNLMTYFDPGRIATAKDPRNPKARYDYAAQGWQTERVPEQQNAPGQPNTSRRTIWDYFDDGQLKSRKDEQGQPSTYTYDANNNLVAAVDAFGLGDNSTERKIETRADYTGFDEVAKVRHRKQGEPNWKVSSYAYDPNGNVTLRLENGEENDAGTQTKAPNRHEISYTDNDWLATQLDLGTDGACRNDQRIVNTFWRNGLERSRDIFRAGDGCTADPAGWTRQQTTNWTFFDNGKQRGLVTKNGSGEVTESHDMGYLDENGRYVNGHRTTDRFILKRAEGNQATTCVGSSTCLATWTYDARDKLIRHQKREGKVTTHKLDEPDQMREVSIGGTTGKYFYDDFGNTKCLTLAAGSAADCGRSDGQPGSPNLVTDYAYDFLNRLVNVRQFSGGGTPTDRTDYTYDALDRTSRETEDHAGGGNDRTTEFTYQGLTRLATEEKQTGGSNPKTKSFSYDKFGKRMSMTDRNNATGQEDRFTYSHDVHGSVSQLIGQSGQVRASYGYDAYGGSDAASTDPEALTTGDTDKQAPINPYRYSGRRQDSGAESSTIPPVPAGSAGYELGARRYGPETGRFLQEDIFQEALGDLGLSLDPLTQNRFALAGGNPVSFVETDGHLPALSEIGNAIKEAVNKAAGAVKSAVDSVKGGQQSALGGADQRQSQGADDDKGPDIFKKIREGADRLKSEVGWAIGDWTANVAGAFEGAAGWLSKRASEAGRNLRSATGDVQRRAAQELAALRHRPWLRSIAQFSRSPAGKWTGRTLGALGFGISFMQNYTEGDKALPAAGKAGIEAGAAFAGGVAGAKLGAAGGSFFGPPGTLIGGLAGGIAGGIGGAILGKAGVQKAEGWIDDKLGKAQDWVGARLDDIF